MLFAWVGEGGRTNAKIHGKIWVEFRVLVSTRGGVER